MTLLSSISWLKDIFDLYAHHGVLANIALTLVILLTAFAARRFLISVLSKEISLETRRKRLVDIRNGIGATAMLLTIMLWSTELKTLIVPLIAIAAAVVLATREVIMCVIGGMVRTTTQRYRIGDRIEIKDFQGDVIDISLLSTALMEINRIPGVQMYTGHIVFIPHSLLLTDSLRVHHLTASYSVHTFSIPVTLGKSVVEEQERLQNVCIRICSETMNEAEKHFKIVQDNMSIDMPSSAPKTLIHSDSKGAWWLTSRIVAPLKELQTIEQRIVRTFLNETPASPIKHYGH